MSPILPIGAAIVGLFALMAPKKAKAAEEVTDEAADTADDAAESGAGKAGGSASSGAGGAGGAGKKASGAAEAQRVIAEEAAAALASGDPERIEAYAKKIEAYYPDAARDARAVADAIRAARAKAKDTPSPTPSPTPKAPEVVPDGGLSKASKKLAADVALMLQQTKAGKEDQGLLKSFSTANNLRNSSGTFDGLYGRRVGVCLATKYGIVPPRPPVSWGTTAGGYKSMAPDKQLYREAMLSMAEQDDARSDEWTAAARAVKG